MQKSHLIGFWAYIALVYLIGIIWVDIMDVDAAQYASISQEMYQSGSWLEVKHKYSNYLDKPPLLFWLSAFFYQIFGVNQIAYRLPTLLSTVLGLFATYRLGEKLYNKESGQIAALTLATTQAWFLFNHDIRTDTLLSNFVIVAIWQLYVYIEDRKWSNFFLGFAAIGLAMLAKGPIGIVIPAMALGSYLLGRRAWRKILDPKWLLGIVVVLIVLSPMLYGLWTQWGAKGIYFFFWEQSFGRITGENVWRDNSGPFFFTHTFLWAFLPWSIFALWALGRRMVDFWNKGAVREMLTLSGFVLPFIALSFSKYKLPHYIFPIFPLMAIMVAHEIHQLRQGNKGITYKAFFGGQLFLNVLIWVLMVLLCVFVFPTTNWALWLLIISSFAAYLYYLLAPKLADMRLISPTIIAFVSLNLVLNAHFYPTLLQYQSGSQAARFILKNKIPTEEVAVFGLYPNSLDFYMHDIAQIFEKPEILIRAVAEHPLWIFTNDKGKQSLENSGAIIEQSIEFDHFHVTKLSLKFLNPARRASQVGKAYLLRVTGVLG